MCTTMLNLLVLRIKPRVSCMIGKYYPLSSIHPPLPFNGSGVAQAGIQFPARTFTYIP